MLYYITTFQDNRHLGQRVRHFHDRLLDWLVRKSEWGFVHELMEWRLKLLQVKEKYRVEQNPIGIAFTIPRPS